jgi:serine/threonine protein kinase
VGFYEIYFPAFKSLNTSIEYRLISKKGEGTFSEVLKAQSIKTGKYVAIKCMKNHFDTIEQVSRRFLVNYYFLLFMLPYLSDSSVL